MSTDDDFYYTEHHPENPLPFNIVKGSCGICDWALKELNKYIPYSMFYDKVKITLHKDSAGRGWHIQEYQLGESDAVDLSDVDSLDSLRRKEKEQ